MRILLVNKFYDLRGGTERILFDLQAALEEKGHEVAVFACREKRNVDTSWRSFFADERNYENPSVVQKLKYAAATVYDRAARRSLAALLDEFRPDIAHLHNIYHQLSPSVLDELRARGVPTVMTLHDYKLVCPVYRLFREGQICEECVGRQVPTGVLQHACSRGSRGESALLLVESTIHRLRRSYEKGVDRFICPSEFLADLMRRQGIDDRQLVIIRNAPRSHTEPADADARDSRPTLLCATRLSEEKGIGPLLDAVSEVPEVALRVAGEGPLLDELRERFDGLGQLSWLGKLDGPALQRERARAWMIAVPSVWYENAPLSAIEAFHSGRPVLASDHGGLVEMIDEGVHGWRVPAADHRAWVESLRRLARSADETAEMGRHAARRAAALHDFDDFLRRHLELYEDLLGGRR